ncbi:LARGE xylosyl- and glucuronyltransferase 2-like isoform X1 [Cygnus olor]|uniref:LARGE xylosyl- and glucuronyltransferase 2-like isoform X1 n=1 Tax=Cygnus olor TaxID=8869 RepID=UPI001ADDF63D|nr:LARGE xylosyl- and glucuronyltransferase 2-like isoform X1 [Cygnus olor]
MSAFHREARRRQAALERRRTGPGAGGTRRAAPGPRSPPPPRLQATASLEGDPKHGPGTAVTQSPPPEPRPSRCCRPCHQAASTSARLPNRFTALQYLQQW